MSTETLEDKNAALRAAVEARLYGQAADDNHPVLDEPDEPEPDPIRDVLPARPAGSLYWADAHSRLGRLHLEKTAQYGSQGDPFENVTASAKCGVEPWRRALCDLSDCVVRMQRYAQGQPVDYENALLDAANWALICLVKLEEEKRRA